MGNPQDDAGPSSYAGYFDEIADKDAEDDEETLEDDTLEEERDRYFPEVADEDPHVAMQDAMMFAMERTVDEDDEEDDVNWEGVALSLTRTKAASAPHLHRDTAGESSYLQNWV